MRMERRLEQRHSFVRRFGSMALATILAFGGVSAPAFAEAIGEDSDSVVAGESASTDDTSIDLVSADDESAFTEEVQDTNVDVAATESFDATGETLLEVEDPEASTIDEDEVASANDVESVEIEPESASTATQVADANESSAQKQTTQAPQNHTKKTLDAAPQQAVASVSYRVHMQDYGTMPFVKNGAVAGAADEAKRIEAIWIKLASKPVSGGITYRTYVQGKGWMNWAKNGKKSGTTGQSKRVEAIQIKLTGKMAQKYDVYYRTNVENAGWMAWTKNGKASGSTKLSLRMQAIQVVIVAKGEDAPGDVDGIVSDVAYAKVSNPGVAYRSSMQSTGWQKWVKNGKKSGLAGKSKRVLGFAAKLGSSLVPGNISYRSYVQGSGWQKWVKNGTTSGNESGSKRVEAIRIKLTGEVSKYCNVWYRVYTQTYGWLGWAKNGAKAGTTSLSKRVEAMQIKILPKGASAPGSTSNPFYKTDPGLSGDAELDGYITEFIKQTGTGYEGLRRAYEIISSYPYSQANRWPGANWKKWSIPYAKEMYLNQTGNCYRYASLMCWTARRLGYDAKVVPGWIPGSVNPHCDHGWCEVNLDGEIYIIDAEMNCNVGYPQYNWFMIKYADAHLRYYDLNDNRILR